MVLADMANPPEHDFAPAWLKIPSEQRSSKPPNVNPSSASGRLGPADDHQDRYRARHYSTDSQHSYGRSPTHDQPGYRGRDERRQFSNSSSRHHSVDELPWDPDPTTNWNYSQLNGTSSGTYGMGYPRRGNSVPRSGQQYSNNGRFDSGGGFAATRGQFSQGKPAGSGRQRYNSGPKTGYSDLDDHNDETSSKKEDGQGDGPDDAGKESDKSALSNQDFPSLSGGDVHIKKPSIPTKTSVPPGAWEKPPGTTKVISGRKLQLIKKSIPNPADGKSTPRTMTLSSASIVDPSLGLKVTAQTGASNQSSKGSASSNAGSGVVLKSMISVTPMVSSRAKDPTVRSAPVPVSSSRISPVPSKPSPVPVPVRSVPSNPLPSPAIKVPAPTSTRSMPISTNSPATPAPKQNAPKQNAPVAASKAETVSDKFSGVGNGTTVPLHNKVCSTITKTTTVSSSRVTASDKPVQPTSNKPTMVTSMSTVLTNRLTPAPNRLTASSAGPNRPGTLAGRVAPVFAPRPAPVSTSRHNPVAIINRPMTSSAVITSGLTSVSLRSAPVGSMNVRKEKTVVPLQSSTLLPLNKRPPSPISLSTAPVELPNPSPSTPKAKKGDKIGFLTGLRRSSNGDVSKEVSQNNAENLRGVGETKKQSRPTSTSKTILQKQHPHSKTNGFDIHSNLTTMEKGAREDTTPNFFPEFSPVRDLPDMSSSLEAEKRLLQEMGWHEHSDNEEGYAPLTEDEKKEFQKRKSQQLKKNGFTTRILPSTWNSVSLPISSITQVSLDDTLTSSDTDSSDDDDEARS